VPHSAWCLQQENAAAIYPLTTMVALSFLPCVRLLEGIPSAGQRWTALAEWYTITSSAVVIAGYASS